VLGNLLGPELTELIEKRDFNQLRRLLSDFEEADLAEILSDVSPTERAVLLRILPRELGASVFEYLSLQDQGALLQALGNEEVAGILNQLSPDDRTALLEEMPAAVTQKLLNLLTPEQRKIASGLLGYPKDSIGRLMTPHYTAIQQDWTVNEVLGYLRRSNPHKETLNQLFVVDARGELVARLRLRNVVTAQPETVVTDLLDDKIISLKATDDEETAVASFEKYDVTMLPVVDSEGVLVGVVTVDDVLDVVEKEATEDIQKLGGMEALDAPYLRVGLFRMIQKRAGWLAVLFLGEMLTATAMGYFEDEIAKAVVLALFVPLIISSGGNSGSQATSLVIRAMAVRDVRLSDWWRVLWREIIAGLCLGAVLAGIALLRIFLWPNRERLYGQHYFLIAMTVSCSLVGVVLFGSIAGAMLPLILRRLGFDPAVSSAPLVATLVDVTGLIIYFSVAYWILRGTLL
jgi:magnesium transporter